MSLASYQLLQPAMLIINEIRSWTEVHSWIASAKVVVYYETTKELYII